MLIPFGVFSAAGAGGGASAGSFDLISTTLISTNTTSVTFDVSTLASTYKHLQIRYTARTDRANYNATIGARFNSDTGSNYSYHELYADGSGVSSGAATSTTFAYAGNATGTSAASSIYTPSVMDILDFASTAKYKTTKNITGVPTGSTTYIELMSGNWRNTAAITAITLFAANTTYLTSGSRFSIYGVK